jgi:hypothetical protein
MVTKKNQSRSYLNHLVFSSHLSPHHPSCLYPSFGFSHQTFPPYGSHSPPLFDHPNNGEDYNSWSFSRCIFPFINSTHQPPAAGAVRSQQRARKHTHTHTLLIRQVSISKVLTHCTDSEFCDHVQKPNCRQNFAPHRCLYCTNRTSSVP